VRNCRELNSADDDFAPIWNPVQHTLYFNSDRAGRSLFYIASQNSRSLFSTPAVLNDVLNAKRGNQSYLTIAANGESYFSTFRLGEQRSYLAIFRSSVIGSLWNPPTLVEELSDESFNSHPTVSRSGSTLIFSSNRAGGSGETDLWISRKQTDGNWSQPLNLGETINSSGNEITPFLAGEDSLYFASDGWGGKGGYEIFLSIRIAGLWQPPVPLSEINSEYDDSDFALLDNETALFASNRTGGLGKLDIYQTQRKVIGELKKNLEVTLSTLVPNIIVQERQGGTLFPMIPVLYFTQNSDELSLQYKREQSSVFSERTISDDADSVYARTLDIIGSRMKTDSSSTLTVIGWADKSTRFETIELAGRRAETVKKYLTERWVIKANRVILHASEPSDTTTLRTKGQYARVDLQPDSPNLLAPIILQQAAVKITPLQLELGVDARPRSLLKSWQCFVGNKSIASSTQFPTLPAKFLIRNEELRAYCSSDSLEFILRAIDTLGNPLAHGMVIPVQHIRTKTNSLDVSAYMLPIIQPTVAAAMVENITRNSGITAIILQPYTDVSGKLHPLCRSAIEEIKLRAAKLALSVKVIPRKEKELPTSIEQFAPFYLRIAIERREP
jgi:Tol biopolymer transport system component